MKKDGLLYRCVSRLDGSEEVLQLILPVALKRDVLTQLHQHHGHQGVERTTELIHQWCYWPGMSAEVAQWCREWERCQLAKDTRPLARGFMGHDLASKPNEILAIDFTMLEPSCSGHENVLVLTDVFNKYTLAVPTRDQWAESIVQALVAECFFRLGVPGRIHSDEGQNFESALMKQLCGFYGIERSRTTPYHPNGNGQCEWFNRGFLHTLPVSRKRDWASCLPQIFSAITPLLTRPQVSLRIS